MNTVPMSRKTLLVTGLLLCAAGSLWFARPDSGDADLANRLVRERNRAAAVTTGRDVSDMFKLNDTLIAERDDHRDIWTVSQVDGSSVALPFAPPRDGRLPDAQPVADVDPDENPGYLGAESCKECHLERFQGFAQTAHHLTSGLATPTSVHGHFGSPRNKLATSDPKLSFELAQQNDRLFQTLHFDQWDLQIPMDVYTGSAKTGQSMLYWHGDALYQAHVSYLTKLDAWITSPGYPETEAIYWREIRAGCLECHITYINQKQAPNFYHRDSAIFGISCERCHGPGRDHVDYHREFPKETIGKHIVDPKSLTRQQQLDICAQCHSGSFKLLKDAFTFSPGNELDEYHQPLASAGSGAGGIHTSNQLTRLAMSRCFQQSEMTCTTCHDPHVNQRGQTQRFTEACLRCHQVEHCGMSDSLGPEITDGCIRCHMPSSANQDMLDVASDEFAVEMADHYIQVVRQEN